VTARTEHDSAVRGLYERLIGAWNDRDAAGFAGLFNEDGVSIGFDGSQMVGREIRDQLSAIFDDHATATYVARVRAIRSLGPDAALLRAIVGMVPRDADELNPEVNALQSLVAERRGDRWSIVLFQNTPAQYHGRPELAERHTAEVERVRADGVTIA
jgi:uncharacterized protein (TIGR02246 family)